MRSNGVRAIAKTLELFNTFHPLAFATMSARLVFIHYYHFYRETQSGDVQRRARGKLLGDVARARARFVKYAFACTVREIVLRVRA